MSSPFWFGKQSHMTLVVDVWQQMNCQAYTEFVVQSQTLLYRHSLNVYTSMLPSVCFVPKKKKAFVFSLNSTCLIWKLH